MVNEGFRGLVLTETLRDAQSDSAFTTTCHSE
jgi:hypothetical protein